MDRGRSDLFALFGPVIVTAAMTMNTMTPRVTGVCDVTTHSTTVSICWDVHQPFIDKNTSSERPNFKQKKTKRTFFYSEWLLEAFLSKSPNKPIKKVYGNTPFDTESSQISFFVCFFFYWQLATVRELPNGPSGDTGPGPVAKHGAARCLIKVLLKPVKSKVKTSVSPRKAFSSVFLFLFHLI